MSIIFISDQTFKGQDFTTERLPKGAYENCIFEGCDFSEGYLDNQNFMECEFVDCNLSNVNLKHTTFKETYFSHCKMIGLKFEDCDTLLLNFSFQDCRLNFSSFIGLNLKNQKFDACKLIQVDFSKAQLGESSFHHCDLKGAIFERTNLERADFTLAVNYRIDPETNRVKKAEFSKDRLLGLLGKYDIVVK